jgi:hypothetical protein
MLDTDDSDIAPLWELEKKVNADHMYRNARKSRVEKEVRQCNHVKRHTRHCPFAVFCPPLESNLHYRTSRLLTVPSGDGFVWRQGLSANHDCVSVSCASLRVLLASSGYLRRTLRLLHQHQRIQRQRLPETRLGIDIKEIYHAVKMRMLCNVKRCRDECCLSA